MAYANKYRITFDDFEGTEIECTIQQDGYSGSVKEIRGGSPPLLYQTASTGTGSEFRPIFSINAIITLWSEASFQFIEFYNADEFEYKLIVKDGGTNKFRGYLAKGAGSSEPWLSDNYPVRLTFNDGLSILKKIPFNNSGTLYSGKADLIQIVSDCLTKIDSGNNPDIYTAQYFQEASYLTNYRSWESIYVDRKKWREGDLEQEEVSCYEVLEDILKPFFCQIRFYEDDWYITNIAHWIDRTNLASSGYVKYNSSGVYQSQANLIDWERTIDFDGTGLRFLNAGGATFNIINPFDKIDINYPLDNDRDWIDGNFSDPDQWSSGSLVNWTETGSPGVNEASRNGEKWLELQNVDTTVINSYVNLASTLTVDDGTNVGEKMRLTLTYMIEENASHTFTVDTGGQITGGPDPVEANIRIRLLRDGRGYHYGRVSTNTDTQTYCWETAITLIELFRGTAANNWDGVELNKELTYSTELVFDSRPNEPNPIGSEPGNITMDLWIYVGVRVNFLVKSFKLEPLDVDSNASGDFTIDSTYQTNLFSSPISLGDVPAKFLSNFIHYNALMDGNSDTAPVLTTQWLSPKSSPATDQLQDQLSDRYYAAALENERIELTTGFLGEVGFMDYITDNRDSGLQFLFKNFTTDVERRETTCQLFQTAGVLPNSGFLIETEDFIVMQTEDGVDLEMEAAP